MHPDLIDLIDLLAEALPYVEDAQDDPTFKPSGKARAARLAHQMREAIEKREK